MSLKFASAGNRGDKVRSDCWVQLQLTDSGGINLNLKSKVDILYGESIRKLVVDMMNFFEIDHAKGVITKWIEPNPNLDKVEAEVKRQIEKFLYFGLKADHINSHHHAHLNPQVFSIVCKQAKEFNIPFVRFFKKFYPDDSESEKLFTLIKDNNIKTIDHFIEGWYWGNVDEEYQVAELMTHPGYGEILV